MIDDVLFCCVSHEYDVCTVCVDGDTFGEGLVECALPPIRKVVNWVAQSFALHVVGVDVKDRHLLSAERRQNFLSSTRDKNTIVSVNSDIHTHFYVFGKQTDIA